jgi:hypothetical protein
MQIELWHLYSFMAALQPIAAHGGAGASSARTCVQVVPLLYRPHGPINATTSSGIGASVMSGGSSMPMWEQDAWGYPYPTNR